MFADPGRVNLRKGARATLVVTVLFSVMVAFGDAPMALFASFGSLAALVFADFGGSLVGRLRAYGGLLVGGALLVGLGTAVADTTAPAVASMVVVAFGVTFSGALGGYFAAGATATILAFVLSVMSPGVGASLVAALEDLVLEHGGGHVDRAAWGSLLADATRLELAGPGGGMSWGALVPCRRGKGRRGRGGPRGEPGRAIRSRGRSSRAGRVGPPRLRSSGRAWGPRGRKACRG